MNEPIKPTPPSTATSTPPPAQPGIIVTPPKVPLVNPFGRPILTECVQRVYKPATGAGPDGFGPASNLPARIAPQGRGAHCVAFRKPAGHSLALAFAVADQNIAADWFEFAKELNRTTLIPMDAYLMNTNNQILGHWTGRDTDTDQNHCWYVHEGNPHNGRTLALPSGTYFYFADTPDGSAAEIPVWHSGSNQFN